MRVLLRVWGFRDLGAEGLGVEGFGVWGSGIGILDWL